MGIGGNELPTPQSLQLRMIHGEREHFLGQPTATMLLQHVNVADITEGCVIRDKAGQADLRRFEWYYLRRQQYPELFALPGHGGPVIRIAWHPDGKRLVSFGITHFDPDRPLQERISEVRGEIKLWDVATRQPLPLRLDGAADKVTRGCLSSDGKLLAGGAVSYRGMLYYRTPSQKLARLNNACGVLEYEVDAAGNTTAKVWEWK